jgi:uncharacterized metal-binding protein YceD (DUF177 family)
MAARSFVVRLADLERGPRKVTFSLSEEWLAQALGEANASPVGPGSATVELQKAGATVMVRGAAEAKVTVPCVVTLEPVPVELKPEIFLQLVRDPEPHDRPKAAAKHPTKGRPEAKEAKSKGGAREKGEGGRAGKSWNEPELTDDEAAYDTFKGEEIALDDFFREFLLLEIPPYPRRSDLPSPEESLSSRPLEGPPGEAKPIDPRLLPLQGLANRLRGAAKNKE